MNKLFLFCMIFILLNACQAAKDGLTKQKRSNADEFLVEKKNPLVLPPEFGDLPSPDGNEITQQNGDANSDIKSLLSKDSSTDNQSSKTTGTSNIENSVLEKIKNR
tara:strand:+ start:335 stop:652 length:318 start_codon:yes stop_codon:yes gene_type:complete